MNHRQRAAVALNGGIGDYVPTFELVFDETERDFQGRAWIGGPAEPGVSDFSYTDKVRYNAVLYVDVARRYDHSIIFVNRDLGRHENREKSGVRDIIKEINHEVIESVKDYKSAIQEIKDGESVNFFIWRKNAGFLVIKFTK